MEEYREDGCRLGWLLDRIGKQAYIYREDGSVEIRKGSPVTLDGEAILPDLTLTIAL